MLNSYVMWTLLPDPTHFYLQEDCSVSVNTLAECPVICSNSIWFVRGFPDAALLLLLGWLVCSLLAANGLV